MTFLSMKASSCSCSFSFAKDEANLLHPELERRFGNDANIKFNDH